MVDLLESRNIPLGPSSPIYDETKRLEGDLELQSLLHQHRSTLRMLKS